MENKMFDIKTLAKTARRIKKKGPIALQSLIQAGNKKLPRSTAIFNMSSTYECSSLKLGYCQAVIKENGKNKLVCYARKAEKMYPQVLPYRRRQEKFWKETSAIEWATQFLFINALKRKPFEKIRFNEAGDFHDQSCVDKVEEIAKILAKYGVRVYCYTARKDLDYSNVKHFVINASGFEHKDLSNDFRMVKSESEVPDGYQICGQDCNVCSRCSVSGSKNVVVQH
jgi:hypothetical protein